MIETCGCDYTSKGESESRWGDTYPLWSNLLHRITQKYQRPIVGFFKLLYYQRRNKNLITIQTIKANSLKNEDAKLRV